MKRNIELLAPAGSYEGFEAALGAGADAVYVGGSMFGARAYAQNFTQEELLKAIDTAHIHGRKLYLTVNTLLKNRELKGELIAYLTPYYEAGLDAVIVQDMGVFAVLKQEFPGLHLHASTQMTVTGPESMKFWQRREPPAWLPQESFPWRSFPGWLRQALLRSRPLCTAPFATATPASA